MMKQRFTIHEQDAGTEAYTDDYVLSQDQILNELKRNDAIAAQDLETAEGLLDHLAEYSDLDLSIVMSLVTRAKKRLESVQ